MLNLGGHFIKSALVDGTPGFFVGYDKTSIAVVAVNACFGIVVTAVYKYADAGMKCMANAVTTVMLLTVSWALFGLQVPATTLAGCIVVIVAVALYSTTTLERVNVVSSTYRMVVAGLLAALACFILSGIASI